MITGLIVQTSARLIVIPLLLGSWYGLLIVPVMILAMVPRAVLKGRLLERNLPGDASSTLFR